MNRREFLDKIAGGVIFAVILALTGFLFFKEETGETCELEFVCKNCKQNKSCNLDEAKEFRKSKS